MDEILLANLDPNANQIRGLHLHESLLAVLVGDQSQTHTIHWVRLNDGVEQRRFAIPLFDEATDPAVSPDLALIAYAEQSSRPGYPRVVLERPGQPALRREIQPLAPYGGYDEISMGFRRLAYNSDATALLASFENGELTNWDIRNALNGQAEIPVTEFAMEMYPPVLILLHGRPPSFGGAEAHLIACEGAMLYLRTANMEASPLNFRSSNNYTANPQAAAFAPDGQSFAVAFTDRLVLWGTEVPFRPPERAQVPMGSIRAMAFHPDGRRLITASEDGTVRLWNENLTGPAWQADWGVPSPGGIAFTDEGARCVLGGAGGRLVVRTVE
jgi:hypothetical protein